MQRLIECRKRSWSERIPRARATSPRTSYETADWQNDGDSRCAAYAFPVLHDDPYRAYHPFRNRRDGCHARVRRRQRR